jgi:hypothetical protein
VAQVEEGPWFNGRMAPAPPTREVHAVNRNPPGDPAAPARRPGASGPWWTTLAAADGRSVWMHPWSRTRLVGTGPGAAWACTCGTTESGIGTKALPAVFSDVAAFGVGDVVRDGKVVAGGVPVHVMTMNKGPGAGGAELVVGRDDPRIDVPRAAGRTSADRVEQLHGRSGP